jgi:hypothetical protein
MWKGVTLFVFSVQDSLIDERGKCMKKGKTTVRDSGRRAEYDFRGGIRGKYAARYAEGANVVLLEPDVAEYFPNATAVNDVLRALVAIVNRHGRPKGRTATARKTRRRPA